ncbi:hypothetical protein CPB85DRAFT_97718 [Mucidula mucida]|nr:hypothetical protein CPB85DRAFT_97718 [Mucidula mucida]
MHLLTELMWHTVYSRCLKTFRLHSEWTLIIQAQSSAFLSLDGFSLFMTLLLNTPSRYISLEVFNAELLHPCFFPTPCITPRKWLRLVIKRFLGHLSNINSDVGGTTSPLRLSFSARDHTSTLCIYLDGSNSSTGNSESLMAVINHLLSLDASIMLDDLDVEGSYAPLVVELLPALLRNDRLLRLQGLPVDSVACTRLSLCVKLPAALILDFSTPNAISTFVSWLPRILTSIQDERRAQPLRVYLCFKYDAMLGTKDHRLCRTSKTSLQSILSLASP